MARYNTSLASATITGAATISTPNSGAFTALTGTPPYTVTLPAPSFFPGTNQTFYNATVGTVTLSTPSGIFSGTGGSGLGTVLVYAGNVVSIISDGTNYIVISEDGSAMTATTGSFSGNVTVGGILTVQPSGGVSMAPSSAGSIDNVAIGATARSSGAFTTLSANSQMTVTVNTASTSTSTGSLVVTGGVGVTGTINAASVVASLTGTIQTAAQPNITSVGGLTAPQLILAPSPVNSAGIIRRSAVSGSNGIRIQGNTADAYPNDTNAGAYIVVGGGVIGDTFEGNIDIVAYGGNVDANRNQIRFSNRSGTDTITERMRINKDGFVGIGTSNPQQLLQIQGPTAFDSMTALNITNGSNDYGRAHLRLTGRIQASNDGWSMNGRANILFAANAAASGASVGAIGTDKFAVQYNMLSDQLGILSTSRGSNPIVTVTQGGNTGFNITNPQVALHVKAASGASGSISLSGTSANDTGGASYILMGNTDSAGTSGPSVIWAANRSIGIGRGDSFVSNSGGSITTDLQVAAGAVTVNGTLNTGALTATNLYISTPVYSASYTYSSSWASSLQTIVPTGVISANTTFLVDISTDSYGGPPYYSHTSFLYRTTAGTNGAGNSAEQSMLTSHHIPSSTYWAIAALQALGSSNGLSARLVNGPALSNTIYVRLYALTGRP